MVCGSHNDTVFTIKPQITDGGGSNHEQDVPSTTFQYLLILITLAHDAGDVGLAGGGDNAIHTGYLCADQYPLARIPDEL
jgi:hypothetical protein